jgi:hypothetical protein
MAPAKITEMPWKDIPPLARTLFWIGLILAAPILGLAIWILLIASAGGP